MLCTAPVIISVAVVGGVIGVIIIGALVYFVIRQFMNKPAVSKAMSPARPIPREPMYGYQRPSNASHFYNWV